MSKYILWDRHSSVITPSGEIFSAQDWENRYPSAQVLLFVMSGEEKMPEGFMSGAFMQSYPSMKNMYEQMGCDFTGIAEGQPVLDAIEAFEIEQAEREAEEAQRRAEEAIAEAEASQELVLREIEALEDLVVLNMPDVPEE